MPAVFMRVMKLHRKNDMTWRENRQWWAWKPKCDNRPFQQYNLRPGRSATRAKILRVFDYENFGSVGLNHMYQRWAISAYKAANYGLNHVKPETWKCISPAEQAVSDYLLSCVAVSRATVLNVE